MIPLRKNTPYPLGGGFSLHMTTKAYEYYRSHLDELKRVTDEMKDAYANAQSSPLNSLVYKLPAESIDSA